MKLLKVLYISGWSINDPLTISTCFPTLKVIEESQKIKSIDFVTWETKLTNEKYPTGFDKKKVNHLTFKSNNLGLVGYLSSEIKFIKFIKKLHTENQYNIAIARGAMAGGRLISILKKQGVKLYVESFEPHADYMYYSNTWSRLSPKYLLQKYWEQKQMKYADALITVSHKYRNFLIEKNINAEIKTLPCPVGSNFKYSKDIRKNYREKLKIPEDHKLFIYVGKFGGLYYEQEAIRIIDSILNKVNTSFIILSPQSKESILALFEKEQAENIDKVKIDFIPHKEVASYLCAADAGVVFVRESLVSEYCSPVKSGEYMACGLPVFTPDKIGDDSSFIKENSLGTIFVAGSTQKYASEFFDNYLIVTRESSELNRKRIMNTSQSFRSRGEIANVYKELEVI